MRQAPSKLRFAVVAVDIVVFSIQEGKLKVLLMDIDRPPHYKNIRGFIGGIIDVEETAEDAVARHLMEKGNVKNIYTEQLYTFSEKERDLRNRVISVGYMGLVPSDHRIIQDKKGMWVDVSKVGKLAYDHNLMLKMARERLAGRLSYTNSAQHLLPNHFTLSELQEVYEVVIGVAFDKRNFRKKILSLGLVEETGERQEGVANRPALLYRFKEKNIKVLPLFA